MIDSSFISQSAKTRIGVFNATARLLRTEELDSISVRQICEEAKVGRSTFYAYFTDKYAVIQWFTDVIHRAGAAEIGRTLSWEEGHRITTGAYISHIGMLNAAARSSDYNAIGPYSVRRWEESLKETIVEYKHLALTRKLELQIAALSTAATAVASYCFASQDMPLDEIVDALISITPPDLYELLATPVFPSSESAAYERSELALINLLSIGKL